MISETLHWYALRTHPRREHSVAERLAELGHTYYLPVRIEKRQWSDRIKTVEAPLIPAMVFVQLTVDQSNALLTDPHLKISYLFDHANRARLVIPDRQMNQFMRLTSLQQEGLTLLDDHLKPGDRVRVVAGDFAGIEGELIRVKGHKRVVVRLEGLFALATTYIPSQYLERVEGL